MKKNPSVYTRNYLVPRAEVFRMVTVAAILFASDDDDWGEIPPIEGDDEDDF